MDNTIRPSDIIALILLAVYGFLIGSENELWMFVGVVLILLVSLIIYTPSIKKMKHSGYEWRTTDLGEFEHFEDVQTQLDIMRANFMYAILDTLGGLVGLIVLGAVPFFLAIILKFDFLIYLSFVWPPANLLKCICIPRTDPNKYKKEVKKAVSYMNGVAKIYNNFKFRVQVDMEKNSVSIRNMRGLLEPVHIKDENLLCTMINVNVNRVQSCDYPYAYLVFVFKDADQNRRIYRHKKNDIVFFLEEMDLGSSFEFSDEYNHKDNVYVVIVTKCKDSVQEYYTDESEMESLLKIVDALFSEEAASALRLT